MSNHHNDWKVVLVIMLMSSILMSASYTMLVPFLPMYLMQELGVSADDVKLWSGLVFSVSFAISGIMAPIWGAMADKKSRKLMAVRAAVCLGITYVLGGAVQNEWQLLIVRILQGFSAGLWPACLAIMTQYAPREKMGFCLGSMQGAMTAGGVLGPLLGGVLAEYTGMRMTFYIGGVALLIIAGLLIFYIKETPRKPTEHADSQKKEKVNLLKIPVIQRMLLTAAMLQLMMLIQQPIMPLYVAELQGSMDQIVLVTGLLFSVVGISGVIASPLWGIAGQKWGFRPVLYFGLISTAIITILQALPNDIYAFGTLRFIGGLAFAGLFPAINAVLTQSSSPEDRGRVFGLSYAAQQVGSVIGPILGGALAIYLPLKVVIALSGVIIIPLAIYLIVKRPKQEANSHGNPMSVQNGS